MHIEVIKTANMIIEQALSTEIILCIQPGIEASVSSDERFMYSIAVGDIICLMMSYVTLGLM